MLSRVAESIYWMSRYIERAGNVTRYVSVNFSLNLDTNLVLEEQWEPLLHASGDYEAFYHKFQEFLPDEDAQVPTIHKIEAIKFLTFDFENPNSVFSCLAKARDNARLVRGYISQEMWEHINKLYHYINDPTTRNKALTDPINFFQELRLAIYTLNGMTDDTYCRDDGWFFQQFGTFLERADQITRILDVKYFILLPKVGHVGSVIEDMLWAALLQSVSGFQTFKQKYHRISPEKVVDFLLLNREFPRSVLFCLKKAEKSLFRISGTQKGYFSNSAEQKVARLRGELEYSSVDEIIIKGLHEYLENLQIKIFEIGEDIYKCFFEYAEEEFFPRI